MAPDLTSGALLLQRVKLGTGGQCSNQECTRAGRFRIRIAGHYVKGPSVVQPYSFLCPKCAKAELKRWNELTGRVDEDAAAEAVAA
jgi:hypothetical protein